MSLNEKETKETKISEAEKDNNNSNSVESTPQKTKTKGKGLFHKLSLKSLFRNNKFVLVLSLFIAVVIWINMSLGTDNTTNITVSDIPINVTLSDEATASGLIIFSGGNQTGSVSVSGNRATLGALSSKDIQITAQTANTITTTGTYTLSLSAKKSELSSDFTIESGVSPSVITVFVDYNREKTFDIKDNIVYQVADGYYAATGLSSPSVTISGPQSEISKIDSVVVQDNLDGTLSSDVKKDETIKLYDSSGYEVSSNLLNLSVSTVTANITVLPEKTLSINPTFKNKPSGLTLSTDIMSIDPSSVLIAGPKATLDGLKALDLDTLDFSTLSNKKQSFDVSVKLPDDCRNLSNKPTAKVTLDLSSMTSKTFTVSKFSVTGLASGYSSKVTTQSLDVTIVGPESQIDALSDSDITGVISTENSNVTTGSTSMPVSIQISGADSSWAYGTYKANVTVSKS